MHRTQLTSGIYGNPNLTPSVYNGINGLSIRQPSGYYGTSWPVQSGSVIPQGISTGGWGLDPTTPKTYDRGYPQQTFLGASIRNFSMNGGFGDSSSTLSIDLVVDEYNKSDNTAQGAGDDVYHSGNGDGFVPPIAGSPVFFKFGQNFATVEEAYRATFDSLYRINTLTSVNITNIGSFDKNNFTSLNPYNYVNLAASSILDFSSYYRDAGRGSGHIVFGGILQSYIQNRGPAGNPTYSVQVVDPREILSNVVLILNNYAGSSFGTKNIFNVYGFLEHNFSTTTSGILNSTFGPFNMLQKYVDNATGAVTYSGSISSTSPVDCWVGSASGMFGSPAKFFPFTGTGMSRRSPQGIPYYRVAQAMRALLSVDAPLPQEYINKSYGGTINFRGYNYVIDFSGLPTLPALYFLDFDQINLLDLALEICEITSRDLYVSLLPVINHPACSQIYSQNGTNLSDPTKFIAGIIRLDAIDRSTPPSYGSIKRYIDRLAASGGIYVENQDVGYELSNLVTDKFVVGAQEVDMYCFSTNADRDFIEVKGNRTGEPATDGSWRQWTLEKQLTQQVLPYYGQLGQNAVTIPKGWGAYQQILLDTTGLNAKGVGSYYVATEMELRSASISYECWKNFLAQYNDIYLESIEEDDSQQSAALSQTMNFGGVPGAISDKYVVTVPRSVFRSYPGSGSLFGPDELPSSPCNPPYGYPLYYKRMTKLGIPEGGLTKLQSRITGLITGGAAIRGADANSWDDIKNSQLSQLEEINYGELTPAEQIYYTAISGALNSTPPDIELLNNVEENLHQIGAILPRLAKKGTENALKVYNFLKKIADENLGKKFLVRIPNKVNLFYAKDIVKNNSDEYTAGPFGFRPRPVTSGISEEFSSTFIQSVSRDRPASKNAMESFLSHEHDPNQDKYVGGLRVNFNPMSDKYEFNYTPTNLGGYFPFDLYTNTLTFDQINALSSSAKPLAVLQQLAPQDATNFIDKDGRLSAYVRFDNSEYLHVGSMSPEDFTQQLITAQGMIPDLCEFLDNTSDDDDSFNDANAVNRDNTPLPRQCLFVKCTVDENFYMPPKTSGISLSIYGEQPKYRTKTSKPRKIFIPCSGWKAGSNRSSRTDLEPGTGCYVDSFRFLEASYYPTTTTQRSVNRLDFLTEYVPELGGDLIKTGLKDLDTNYVYALITLPERLIPTKDSRFLDSVNQQFDTKTIKHYITADVVKGLPEFNSVPRGGPDGTPKSPPITAFPAEVNSKAWMAAKQAKRQLQFALPYQINMAAPSPVYPNLVVLPLISNERCYGPWISSQVDPQSNAYTNVGGRVEFIKDENLAPWNYGGYELLNQAGVLQAQFANSLFLFSERGGFSFPGIPDRSLCQALEVGGPLVTNISVDVSENGLRTTYKLDLYTSSFGKLQKQKQDMISKISRERQKLRDERNSLIRKGLGKSQAVNNIGSFNLFANNGTPMSSTPNNYIALSVNQYETKSYSPILGSSTSEENITDYNFAGGLTSESEIINTMNMMTGDKGNVLYNERSYKSGGASINELFSPFSKEYNPYMPNVLNVNHDQTRLQFFE